MITLLREERLRYVAVNRRTFSSDLMGGYFFAPEGSARAETASPAVSDKFDAEEDAFRIFDSGDIALYDLDVLLRTPPAP
jgi:hypothetical protein